MAKNKRNQQQKTETAPEAARPLAPWMPVTLLIPVVVCWMFFIIKNYWGSYPFEPEAILSSVMSLQEYPALSMPLFISTWADHLLNLFLVACFCVSVYGWGNLVFRNREFNAENNLFKMAFGLGITSLGTYFVGLAGLLYPYIMYTFVGLGFISGFIALKKHFQDIKVGRFIADNKLILFFLAFLSLPGLIDALAPETFYDSGMYHLGVPQAWINAHRIYEIPTIHMSFYPFNIEMLYMLGMILNNEMTSKLIHFCLGMLTLSAIYVLLKKYFAKTVAWLAVIIFWATPVVLILAGRSAVELGLALFETLAFFAFMNWLKDKEMKWLVISGLCSGLGMGAKYISVYAGFSIFVLIFVFSLREKLGVKGAVKNAAIFVFVAAVTVSPWLIKNMIWTGNPFYPMVSDSIGHLKMRMYGFLSDPPRRIPTLKNIITLPWEFTMAYPGIQEPYCGSLFLLLLPLLVLFKRRNKTIDPFILYSLIYFSLWEFIQPYVRLFVPAIPVMASVYAYFVGYQQGAGWRKFLFVIIGVMCFGNFMLGTMLLKGSENPLGVSLGLVSKHDYLSKGQGARSYVSPDYAALDWLNKNTEKNAKVLFLGETRGLYCERQLITSAVADYTPAVELAKASRDEDELYKKLTQLGITHLFMNDREVYRLRGYKVFYMDERDWAVFDRFWDKYVVELYSADWCGVYKLVDGKGAVHVPPRNVMREIRMMK